MWSCLLQHFLFLYTCFPVRPREVVRVRCIIVFRSRSVFMFEIRENICEDFLYVQPDFNSGCESLVVIISSNQTSVLIIWRQHECELCCQLFWVNFMFIDINIVSSKYRRNLYIWHFYSSGLFPTIKDRSDWQNWLTDAPTGGTGLINRFLFKITVCPAKCN